MTKAIRWLLKDEDRLIDKIDRRKAQEDTRRGSVKRGKIIRTEHGAIKRVVVS